MVWAIWIVLTALCYILAFFRGERYDAEDKTVSTRFEGFECVLSGASIIRPAVPCPFLLALSYRPASSARLHAPSIHPPGDLHAPSGIPKSERPALVEGITFAQSAPNPRARFACQVAGLGVDEKKVRKSVATTAAKSAAGMV